MKPSSTEARDNGRRDAHRTWRRRRRQHQKSLAGFFSLFSPVFFSHFLRPSFKNRRKRKQRRGAAEKTKKKPVKLGKRPSRRVDARCASTEIEFTGFFSTELFSFPGSTFLFCLFGFFFVSNRKRRRRRRRRRRHRLCNH